jgi:hypothetical protein
MQVSVQLNETKKRKNSTHNSTNAGIAIAGEIPGKNKINNITAAGNTVTDKAKKHRQSTTPHFFKKRLS